MSKLETDGKFYNFIAGAANINKYSPELKSKIEKIGELCLKKMDTNDYSPIMMLGSIQSGKTRAFIGLMSLCFDNGFDMAIILTKCSKALVEQTVKRMDAEFAGLKSPISTVGDVVAQDILDISFRSGDTEQEKEKQVKAFLKKYPYKKRILVVKKQSENVDRINMLIRNMVMGGKYKRILLVDDEADITSVGYEKDDTTEQISLRRISGAINTARQQLSGDVNHVLLQVTATPYALYLQPETFTFNDIMPIRPDNTIVLPTGKGYIGAQYYFMDSTDTTADNYAKAKYLPYFVSKEEMDILNGNETNKNRGKLIKDGRTLKKENFLDPSGKKYPIQTFRRWVFDCIVGAAIFQLNDNYKDCYLSAVLHATTSKDIHKRQVELLEEGINSIKNALEYDLNAPCVLECVKESYDSLRESVDAYGVLDVPKLEKIMYYIAHRDEYGDLDGLISSIGVKQVNSDHDIKALLNVTTGELRLENYLTFFIGGQVIDRGITIPNLISFFYGRDPKKMQQDTVMQHCRMFGYRSEEILSVTRFYTTQRIFNNMQEIGDRDAKLRDRMEKNSNCGLVYLEAGNNIIACSPDKIMASDIRSILPEKRYLPVGFEIKKNSYIQNQDIEIILAADGIGEQKDYNRKKGGDIDESYCDFITPDHALELIRLSYKSLEPDLENGKCNCIHEMENAFLFAIDPDNGVMGDKIAILVRRQRVIAKYKTGNGEVYQDAPDDGNNEGAIAKILRVKYPVLIMTEQTNPVWKYNFWWPIFYTPSEMNVGIYSSTDAEVNVYENIYSNKKLPMQISDFPLLNVANIPESIYEKLQGSVKDIILFHSIDFDVGNIFTGSKKREDYTCRIFIDHGPTEREENRFKRKLERTFDRVKKIFAKGSSSDIFPFALQSGILKYLERLAERIIDEDTDALMDNVMKALSSIKNVDATFIRKDITMLAEMIPNLFEVLGYFKPLGGGMCEIHLYYDRIVGLTKQTEEVSVLLTMVVAHEMEHAWHFADVMTESGKWLFSRSSYMKQGWVKETVAEYFALQYCRQMADIHKQVALDAINKRDVAKFPKDGGYSGALLINGNKKLFDDIYMESLTDLPNAYQKYLKQFAK